MAVIGFIGSGNVGEALARQALAAGHNVVMSNRHGPGSLTAAVRRLGSGASAATPEEAAAAADLVVIAIPFSGYPELPVAALAGKVVIDAGNYWAPRDGQVATLDQGNTTSSEILAARLTGSRVVKAFNTIAAAQIVDHANPSGTPRRRALPIAGDHTDAKARVARFIDEVGFDTVDVGPLSAGRNRVFSPMTAWEPPLDAAHLRAAAHPTHPSQPLTS